MQVNLARGKNSKRNFGKSVCEWTFERLQEACDKVAMEDICRVSIAQEIFQKEH